MPEGPSLVILKEEVARFSGQRIVEARGNARIDLTRLSGRRIEGFRTWGKHLLIDLGDFAVRIHLLMFGSYRIDERKESPPRLSLRFSRGELSFYTCSVRYLDQPLDELYDWSADVMADAWDPVAARRKLRATPNTLACDALLDQTIFAGVGNIIKNEVLFRIRVHPLSTIGALPPRKLRELVDQARQYSFDFLAWKRAFVLRQHWLAHTKRTCPRCGTPLTKAYLGRTDRRSFFCERCQKKYSTARTSRRGKTRS